MELRRVHLSIHLESVRHCLGNPPVRRCHGAGKGGRMIRRLLLAYSAGRPCKIICEADRPYLERYFVCALFGIRFYLHRFVGSDPDRGLHDHPWRWAMSFILRGWYYEATRSGTRAVRWFNFLTGDTFHP